MLANAKSSLKTQLLIWDYICKINVYQNATNNFPTIFLLSNFEVIVKSNNVPDNNFGGSLEYERVIRVSNRIKIRN